MLSITRSGPRIADVIRQVRDIPERVVPYAASSALTRVAKLAQATLRAEMPRVFDRPTAYTLNATFVQPATRASLAARIAVKTQAAGVAPEHYLLPEVEGGGRNEKRFERALRYAGILHAGERVMPGQGAVLDAAGNLSTAMLRGLLRDVQALQRKGQTVAPRRSRKGTAGRRQTTYAGAVGRKATRGIWRREGRGLKALLVFVKTPPRYRQRLDFTGIARQAAEAHFEAEFRAAAASIMGRTR